jgi:hypothetical protein
MLIQKYNAPIYKHLYQLQTCASAGQWSLQSQQAPRREVSQALRSAFVYPAFAKTRDPSSWKTSRKAGAVTLPVTHLLGKLQTNHHLYPWLETRLDNSETPSIKKKKKTAGHQWLKPIILATQEAEMRRITVQSQPGQTVHETLSQKNPLQKKKRLVEWFKW